MARILHVKAHDDFLVGGLCLLCHPHIAVGKGGIAKAETKGPSHSLVRFHGRVVAQRLVQFLLRIAHTELSRWRNMAIENVGHGISALFAGIPRLNNGRAALGKARYHLRPTAEEHQYHRLSRGDKLLYERLLTARQAQRSAGSVLST